MTSEVANSLNVKDYYEFNITGANFLIIFYKFVPFPVFFNNNNYKNSKTKYTIEISIKFLIK